MDNAVKKRRGGPRTFDRDQAVDVAMRLFWRHGYEGVSLNDLTSAIGVAPPSIYAAFGSKAGLYREALDRYFGPRGVQIGSNATATLPDAVESMLRNAVDAVTDPAGERGCMVSSGMLQCAPEHAALASELTGRRREMRETISKAFLRWLDQDRAAALARLVTTIMQGLSVQARDGATRQELYQVVNETVAGVRATIVPSTAYAGGDR
ncbi:TetR family transcriptional regulator [Rhizobium leguminosarum bv. viciae]|uniref:TetR family transcriptional regulator n=1 Tax=Rhizobium leguminosarum bv. viciae TaxID=387 RepID=A0A8I2GYM9_RHILV|nr:MULTISPECIES: TetR/AcrR family transcriptional regulator [Rhizobium]MBY3081067.1 TetR/AcrR family transcriptional regulator [Rhizobium laguerreae]MBY3114967.1 TetR/AcrR family transcriptional regulator [Rhizobium laguerreae]MBY3279849.1 TetR/AcrR family transcriptional regulator [Rhizobium laguerreae]MBY3422472.1 TetR/AcrR family transcriptional regulator [Rhizobium laguerreae]MBY3473382.1 TetR/AcrR family transcriptional regulator [Rhizobium laguerreae]